MNKRKRCVVCGKMTEKWQRVNGSPWHCYDGCFSTTGMDRRTWDMQPAWQQARKSSGKFSFGPWSSRRLKPEYQRYAR